MDNQQQSSPREPAAILPSLSDSNPLAARLLHGERSADWERGADYVYNRRAHARPRHSSRRPSPTCWRATRPARGTPRTCLSGPSNRRARQPAGN